MSAIPFIQVGVGNRGATILNDLLCRYSAQFKPVALVDVAPAFLEAARSQHGLETVSTFDDLGKALAAVPKRRPLSSLPRPSTMPRSFVRAWRPASTSGQKNRSRTTITTKRTAPTFIELNLNTIRWIDATVRSGRSGLPVTL